MNLMRIKTLLPAVAAVLLMAGPLLAAEGEGAGSAGDLGQSLATIAIFVLLLLVLGKWAWRPIVHQLELREKRISDTIEQAQKRQKDAEALLEEYRKRLDAAAVESQELLASARREAATAREGILSAARDENRRLSEDARKGIERASREALQDLYDQTLTMATDIARQIIRKNLNPEDQRRLLGESLAEIRGRVERKN